VAIAAETDGWCYPLAKLAPLARKTGGTMIKKLLRTLVGLSIAAIGTLVPTLASATVWKNYGNEMLCLGNVNGNQPMIGSDLWVKTCNGNLAQTWVEPPYSPGPSGYVWLRSNAGSKFCTATNSPLNGGEVYLDVCQDPDYWEAWGAVYSFNDSDGHPCYYFQSLVAAEQGGATRVLGVKGGIVTDGTHVILWDFLSTHPDQYWCAY
jgi:hypothetical protein